jgi:hypothetical protein
MAFVLTNGQENHRFLPPGTCTISRRAFLCITGVQRSQEINGKAGAGVRDFLAAAFAERCE